MTSPEHSTGFADRESTLLLEDGRTLAYAEYGTPKGDPVLLFPGTPGSRYFHVPLESRITDLGVRLIVPDRPGYGRSTPAPEQRLLDWPVDIVALADELGIETFAVAGHSGGTVYALACATALPDRVSRVGLVSAIAPFTHPEIRDRLSENEQQIAALVESGSPELYDVAADAWEPAKDDPKQAFEGLVEVSPEVDQAVLERPEIREMMIANLGEAFHQGAAVWAHESELFFSDWGFELGDITLHVDIWQGKEDELAPPFMCEFLEEHLPNCTAQIVPREGHTIFVTHWTEILRTLTDSEQTPGTA